jgi:hypothetical protein
MNRKISKLSTLTPKELNMNNHLPLFNSFGVSENLPFIFPIHVQSFQD